MTSALALDLYGLLKTTLRSIAQKTSVSKISILTATKLLKLNPYKTTSLRHARNARRTAKHTSNISYDLR
jgi:hypothetical protein